MSGVNKVMLIGNLTRDPEVRQTAKGNSVAELGLAVNRYYTTDAGEKQEEVTFVEVVLWNRQADTAGQFLQKGRSVYIEGRLQLDTWKDKETGENRHKLKVVGERFQFADSLPRPEDEEGSERDSSSSGDGQSRGGRGKASPRRGREPLVT